MRRPSGELSTLFRFSRQPSKAHRRAACIFQHSLGSLNCSHVNEVASSVQGDRDVRCGAKRGMYTWPMVFPVLDNCYSWRWDRVRADGLWLDNTYAKPVPHRSKKKIANRGGLLFASRSRIPMSRWEPLNDSLSEALSLETCPDFPCPTLAENVLLLTQFPLFYLSPGHVHCHLLQVWVSGD